jgi:hypothetical protein
MQDVKSPNNGQLKKPGQSIYGTSMHINGKPIYVDRRSLALNKRESLNWFIHILFIK